jgi:hypothetical protein
MRSLGVELFHADSIRSDRYDEANRRFPQFCKTRQRKNLAVIGAEFYGTLLYNFKFEILPPCVLLFISYRALNTYHFVCENRPVNVVKEGNDCLV